jgi:hypothetical protein
MSEAVMAPIRSWLAAPMGHEVSAAIERLRRAPDVQQIAVMPDVHLAADVCIGVVVATSHLIYPQAVGGDSPFEGEQLTIQIERDPLEILKLGTYTGTCLGVGGMCSDSAIAALLDVNKKVLYARDRNGRVVARQLIAVADDDRLVCFNVYPLSSSPVAKAAFRDYDRALARALGIPLYEGVDADDPGYQVSSVLSVYWWDDGSWDFSADPQL